MHSKVLECKVNLHFFYQDKNSVQVFTKFLNTEKTSPN